MTGTGETGGLGSDQGPSPAAKPGVAHPSDNGSSDNGSSNDGTKPAAEPARSTPSLTPFGKYLLDEEIASGGMAHVHLARLRGLGGFEKKLVVKQVRPELAGDPQFLSLLVQEANALVQMSHPNIVPVYELGVVDGTYFLAMEFVDGVTLRELLEEHAPLEPALALHIALQVAEALSYAHTRFGLVHRDVTPNNVMLDRIGHVRLLDFGIAAPADGPNEGVVFGSLGYMSPEQARGEAVTPASDLFALGTLLVEALTGEHLWLQEDRQSTLKRLAATEAPDLSHLNAGGQLSPEIVSLIEALVDRDETARPQSATEVSHAFRSWLSNHRPEGVAEALSRCVDALITRRPRSIPPPDSVATRRRSDPPPKLRGGTTQSLATSQTLTAMMGQSASASKPPSSAPMRPDDLKTAPVTGRFPRPDAPKETAPATPNAARHSGRVWAALFLLPALWLAASLIALPALGPAETASEAPKAPTSAPTPPANETSLAEDATANSQEASQRTAPEPRRATGRLTINANPWATVSLDRRPLGETPRQAVAVEEGNHTVTLRCPPFGTEVRVPVTITAQRETRLIADMSTDPPTVRLATR